MIGIITRTIIAPTTGDELADNPNHSLLSTDVESFQKGAHAKVLPFPFVLPTAGPPFQQAHASYLKSITFCQQDIGRHYPQGRPFGLPMNRNASALWKGTLHEGEGTLTTESGVLSKTQYSYQTRFAEGIGTNPDELIAASLSGCFSMALSNELCLCGFHPTSIETTATATLEDLTAGWTLTRIQLDVSAQVPDVSQARFMEAALAAKTNCPISRLLKTTISMTARLTHEITCID